MPCIDELAAVLADQAAGEVAGAPATPSHPVTRLEHPAAEARLPQPIRGRQAGESRPDDDDARAPARPRKGSAWRSPRPACSRRAADPRRRRRPSAGRRAATAVPPRGSPRRARAADGAPRRVGRRRARGSARSSGGRRPPGTVPILLVGPRHASRRERRGGTRSGWVGGAPLEMARSEPIPSFARTLIVVPCRRDPREVAVLARRLVRSSAVVVVLVFGAAACSEGTSSSAADRARRGRRPRRGLGPRPDPHRRPGQHALRLPPGRGRAQCLHGGLCGHLATPRLGRPARRRQRGRRRRRHHDA